MGAVSPGSEPAGPCSRARAQLCGRGWPAPPVSLCLWLPERLCWARLHPGCRGCSAPGCPSPPPHPWPVGWPCQDPCPLPGADRRCVLTRCPSPRLPWDLEPERTELHALDVGQGRASVTPTLLAAFNRGNTKHTGDGRPPRPGPRPGPRLGALRRLHRRRPESSEAPPPEPALRVSLRTVGVSAAHLDVALGSPWDGLSHDP